MRTKSTVKAQKMKKDPFRVILRLVIILAILTAACFAVAKVCDLRIDSETAKAQQEVKEINEQAEAQFWHDLSAQTTTSKQPAPDDPVVSSSDLAHWDAVLEGIEWRIEDMSNSGLENTSTMTLTRQEMLNGGLLLINAWHSLPDDFSDESVVSVGTYSKSQNFSVQVEDNSVKLFPEACDALIEALQDAKADGIEYFIVREGYRSLAAQEELFNKQMEKYSSKYSGKRLTEETKKIVNYPGTSDYHSGLSFRMDKYKKGDAEFNKLKFQAESEQGAWLTEKCWKYGIIFRFPSKDFPNVGWEDKSYITGVSSQLNLYRYVGKPHAAAMKILNMCLEEYIEYLMDHPHICVYEDGSLKYEIVRMKAAEGETSYSLPKPNLANNVQASLDNMGGIVLAYTYR